MDVVTNVNYLSEEFVESFLRGYRNESDKTSRDLIDDILKKGLNFDFPFRQNTFKLVHILLEHALREMYSPGVSDVPALNRDGLLFLFGKERRSDHEDGIEWDLYKKSKNRNGMSKKWDVKKIIFNEDTKSFKLKNNKLGSETELMRRQVWKSKNGPWIKHEYKLLQREIVTDPTGEFLRENVSAQSYPVLVHYFKRRKKRQAPSSSEQKPTKKVNRDEEPMNVMDKFAVMSLNPSGHVEIKTYSPNFGFSSEYTSVLLFMPGITHELSYEARSGEKVVCKASVVGHSLLQITLPPNQPGFISFVIVGKNKYENRMVQMSQEIIFSYLPSDPQGSVQMVGLIKMSPVLTNQFPLYRHTVKVLDLSDNELSNLDFLNNFELLEVLVLFRNRVTSSTSFPYLPKLQDLSVAGNSIDNITKFLETVKTNLPSLVTLNTVDNPCCPYLTKPHEYHQYRMIILAQLPNIMYLDSSSVTLEEKQSSQFVLLQHHQQPQPNLDFSMGLMQPARDILEDNYMSYYYQ
eukprot:TRINITY_DN4428_c0_g1_i1.p1 TRINITY_DN4428_c0_g1~~TRINITY_DN4428_c0_g1_i1.p1  ORF type:complete len:519 (+),score=79.27 TRINITY_DN4428_c0_g1_i1:529-2085(+)